MGLPNITVEFLTKAKTAITRSERGIVCLVVDDTTKETAVSEYSALSEVLSTDYTAENYAAIEDAFTDGPTKVYVVRIPDSKAFTDIEATLDTLKFNWLAYIGQTQTAVPTYVESRNAKPAAVPIKAVVYNQPADDPHVVNFTNTKVKRKDDAAEIDGYKYLGRIAGMLAALPLDRSSTYYIFNDLESVVDVADAGSAVDDGEFVLFNDYGTVRVARGVNSATTVENEDLKKITIVEGMDLMKEDIITSFKESYIGKYKNTVDNQTVFMAAVNTYFRQLEIEDVLSRDFDNLAEIDVEKQRKAWISAGKTEAMDWDTETVKKNPYKTYVYLQANVRFSDAIEDLQFNVYMN